MQYLTGIPRGVSVSRGKSLGKCKTMHLQLSCFCNVSIIFLKERLHYTTLRTKPKPRAITIFMGSSITDTLLVMPLCYFYRSLSRYRSCCHSVRKAPLSILSFGKVSDSNPPRRAWLLQTKLLAGTWTHNRVSSRSCDSIQPIIALLTINKNGGHD